MLSPSDQNLWEKEQVFISQEKNRVPELFVNSKKEPGELMSRIGILVYPTSLPKGYIKYSPLDFIVEEILLNGKVVTVDDKKETPEPLMAGQGTIYADLVKTGISTLDATERIAKALNIENKNLGYAGIKDAVAFTAQTISLRGGVTLEQVKKLSVPGLIIKNITEGKGAIQLSDLQGNRFTLFIRTEKLVDETAFKKIIEKINSEGVPNYFGPQRFGSPRFLSHLLGMYILRGEPKEVIKTYMLKTSPFEIPYLTKIREEAAPHFGDWPAMEKIFSILPYSFRYELNFLEILKQPGKTESFLEALTTADRQIGMWAYAYASFLNNLVLSEAEQSGQTISKEIPQLLTEDVSVHSLYQKWLKEHGTENFVENIKKYRLNTFIHLGRAAIPPRIKPTIHNFKILPSGVAICFDLPKGAYATTILMFLFETITGKPFPEWMNPEEVDTKALLGLGSIAEIKNILAESIGNLMASRVGED